MNGATLNRKYLIMSKEKTPIRKLIDEHIEPAWEGAYNADKEALEKDIQEIINAKVLEALENCCVMSREQTPIKII